MSILEEKMTALAAGNAEWQQRKDAAFARALSNMAPVYIEHALNAEMWDVEGRRYIDFATGIAVCSTGHTNPKVTAAVAAAACSASVIPPSGSHPTAPRWNWRKS